MLMNRFAHMLAACAMLFASGAQANDDFVSLFNNALEQFATGSGINIQYQDVERVRDPMVGNYYAFVNTDITVPAGNVSYLLTLHRVVLYEEDDDIYRVHLPATAEMKMRYQGQEEGYRIRLSGAPNIMLRHDGRSSNFDIKSTPKPAGFGVSDATNFVPSLFKVGNGAENVRGMDGRVTIMADEVTTNGWVRIAPLAQKRLSGYIEELCTALNTKIQPEYLDYAFKGCVWYKR